jgi:phospholipid/cholesterol/gamma-HCH transport system ATP-binding protein
MLQCDERRAMNSRSGMNACFGSRPSACTSMKSVALDSVSFEMHAGETRVMLGAAGSGKTTLLKAAIGLIRRTRAGLSVRRGDHRLEREPTVRHSQQGGSSVSGRRLFDSVTVAENVAYPLLNGRAYACPWTKWKEGPGSAAVCGTGADAGAVPRELSGGMRRRVGIARAVVSEPPLVLYDSPTAGLDPITATTIMALIAKERDSTGHRQPHRDPALPGRATDGQLSIQSQQRTFGAGFR